MKITSKLSILVSMVVVLGCAEPPPASDAAASDAFVVSADAAASDAATSDDAAVAIDASSPVDAASAEDAASVDADVDAGPASTWDDVYALFDDARCGGTRGCHYAGTSGSLSLATSATACLQLQRAGRSATCSLRERIVPGDPDMSLLYRKLSGLPTGCGSRMPEMRPAFSPEELAIVASWIRAGAVCP